MIDSAQKYILIDMFLYNDFQGPVPETHRDLSDELTNALVQKKVDFPDIKIIVITDPINIIYGSHKSEQLNKLREVGVNIVMTDLKRLRDSNPLYSAFWRTFMSWWDSNKITENGFIKNPLAHSGENISLKSYLKLANLKANHRKLIVADFEKDGKTKIATLVTSANPHDGSSAHGNSAVRVNDLIWSDALESEYGVANFSNTEIPLLDFEVSDGTGSTTVQILTEGAIKEKLINEIKETVSGDNIDMAMFYLSEREVIKEFTSAANRGVNIRIILDPSKDAFGREKGGVPNRPVARELLSKTDNKIDLRWCDTHGEQCHSKMTLIQSGDKYKLMLGSANLTRRNIDNYNLETNVWVENDKKSNAIKDAYAHFNKIWDNSDGRIFTTKYDSYKDERISKTFIYHIKERFGVGSF